MKIDTQTLNDRQVELTIEVESEKVQAAMRAAARRLSRGTKIPGFRPGKAPYQVIANRIGEETIFEEALESLGQEVYRSALEESELDPYAPGSLEEVISREPLTLRYRVPLTPEIELGDYRDLRLPYEPAEVSDQAVDDMLEELRQRQALIEPVDRPSQDGDVVILDVYGELLDPEDGEDAKLMDSKGLSILVDPETDFPSPDVYEQLLGIKEGDERSYETTFPEDYGAEDLRGRRARFTLTCQGVKSRHVPEWSDDLAKEIGEFDDLLDLRIKARESLEEQARAAVDSAYAEKVLDAVVEKATVNYPPIVLEEEIDHLLQDLRNQLRGQNLDLEDYLKIENKSLADLRAELEPQARKRAARGLVLGKVVDLEGLQVLDDEIEAEIDRMLEAMGGQAAEQLRKAFHEPNTMRRIGLDLLTQKAIDRLAAIAKGEADAIESSDEPAASEAEAEDQEDKGKVKA